MRIRPATAAACLLLTTVFSFGSVSLLPGSASAMTLQQAQQKLKEIQQKIQEEKNRLAQTQQSIGQEKQTVAQIHQNLDAANQALEAVLNEEATLGRRAQSKQKQIAVTSARLGTDLAVVGSALRAVQQEGTGGYLSVLLSSQSFSDFTVRLTLVAQLITSDMQVVRSVRDLRSTLMRQHDALVSLRAQYHQAAKARSQAKNAVAEQYTAQQQAIAQLDSSYAKTMGALHSDEGNSAEVTQIIQGLESSSNGGHGIGGIHFIWPVVGPITSPFGMRLDPVMHQYWLHTGVDIGVPWGTPIHAAASGKVIVAQWLTGYGYTVIIDDGDGVSNLYAHQSRFNCYVGENVQQGQVIGYVGATGWATGPHLHFEVRINGKPVNPMSYMPAMP